MSDSVKKCGNCANRDEKVETVLAISVYCPITNKAVWREDKTPKSCFRSEE